MKMVVRHRNLSMLIALALIWGSSFLFIKVAVRELTPATLIVGRLGLAAITLGLLVPFVVGTGETVRQLRANWIWRSASAAWAMHVARGSSADCWSGWRSRGRSSIPRCRCRSSSSRSRASRARSCSIRSQ